MEKVFLRVYNREIESMIEGGQLDEAVAHCQYILKTFPMHVETYRLLGKAFLEARRYADAADIFQRVLMAVPDDFVSHVGMSIIRDDGNKLDDAIWHMERAFEVQPSNSAIQGELRRLYGRRDGVEPSKIRLSRDALANMYSQGELFNQAIAEIRSVLADDPNRPDLQVMLMRAYFRSGQKVEAAEIAATLLKKYPYCLDSLRVLVDVLPGTAREENMQVYRHRLYLLDPYSSSTRDSVFSSDQVPDSAVNLERLDYRPGALPGTPQLDWASSLGIKLNTDKQSEPAPEWMQNPEISEKSSEVPPASSEAEAAPSASEAIPDWMRSSGWQEATAESKDGSADVGEGTPDASIAKADIPEWLMSMAPDEANKSAEVEPEEPSEALPAGEEGIPDWLKPAAPAEASENAKMETQENVGSAFGSSVIPIIPGGPAAGSTDEPQGFPEPQMKDDGVPDWLKSMNSTESVEEPKMEPQMPIESQPVGAQDMPDWLKSMAPAAPVEETKIEPQVPVEPQPASAEDMPDWLKSIAPAEPVAETKIEPQVPVEPQPASTDDMPDWLKSLAPAEPVAETKIEPQVPVEPQPASVEDVPDWLKSLAPAETVGNVSAQPAEPMAPQPAGNEAVPDWFKSMTPADAAGDAIPGVEKPVEPQPAINEDVPDWLKSLAPAQAISPSNVESETTHSDIPAVESEPGPAFAETSPDKIEAFPDWLKDMGAGAVVSVPAETPGLPPASAQLVPDLPVPLEHVDQAPVVPPVSDTGAVAESFQPTGEVKPLNIGDDALGWLESLAAKQGAKPEELLTNPQNRSAEMPDWLRQPDEKPIEEPEISLQQPVLSPDQTLPSELSSQVASFSDSTTGQPIDEALPVHEEPTAQPLESGTQSAIRPASGEEDTMAWLERLTGDQEETTEIPSVKPEENLSTYVDENQQISEREPSIPESEGSTSKSLEPSEGEDISITSWLNRLEVEEPSGSTSAEQPGEQAPAESAENLPGWLKDLENSAKSVAIPKVDEDLPEWLRQPTSPMEPEESSAPEVPAWVDENAPVTGQAVPTTPEEWVPVESKPEPDLGPSPIPETAPIKDNLPLVEPEPSVETSPTHESATTALLEPVPETIPVSDQRPVRSATLKQTGMLSPVSVQDKDSDLLSQAQSVLDHDSLDDSMKSYMKLIKKGRLLDEVIHDLREATYRYPVDVIIWQTLGDAYMRANRLQDALDAYTKAEELLR